MKSVKTPPRRGWNGWHHVNGNTYGTWLRGDSRGWRARHHREHVDGDYTSPPPAGMYEALHRYSKRMMKRSAVALSPNARRIACDAMAASLHRHGVELIALAVDDHHFHALCRFPKPRDSDPWASKLRTLRKDGNLEIAIAHHFIGIAKKDSAHVLSDAGLVAAGGVWVVRARVLPVRDQAHQLNVFRYICDHGRRGAAVWTFRDPRPELAVSVK